jgi:2-polyprenyl-3-methyl-5-hydroxy-6-metoxy-1,4-benzoquinol methylase
MTKTNQKNKKIRKLNFTGERLIPELNKGSAFYYEHLARYLFTSQIVNEKVVLDAGCGVGYGSYIMATYGKAKKVYAVDLSQDTIKYAQSKYSNKNIKYNQDNVEELKTITSQIIDVAVSFEVIEHLNDQEKFLRQIKRVLKNDGIFVVSTPNKYTYPSGNHFHTKEIYPEEFSLLLKKFFKNVSFFHQNFELTQTVKPENLKEDSFLKEKFSISEIQVFANKVNSKKSQYIIALCSDEDLPKTQLLAITSQKVDCFDLTFGMLSLSKQFKDLHKNLELLNKKNEELKIKSNDLESYLTKIKSSKFFKLWQTYCKMRDSLFKK